MARKPDLEKRREIAEEAFLLLCEQGIHKTTMSDIANRLGMKRPTLYWYFKDVGEILDALVTNRYQEYTSYLAQHLPPAQHPIDYLKQFLATVVDFLEGKDEMILVLFQMWATRGADERDRLLQRGREHTWPLRQAMAALLDLGVKSGQVRPCDSTAITDLVFAILDGTTMQRLVRGADQRTVLNYFADVVLEPLRIAADQPQQAM